MRSWHGSSDAHGQALQRTIPGAELLTLEQAGHELPAPLWDVAVPALIRHTVP